MESASDGQNTKFNFDLNDEPSADLLAPNVLIEVNVDMFDPLAMPDSSLVDPIDVQIKAEVIDDKPIAMEDFMITDDPIGLQSDKDNLHSEKSENPKKEKKSNGSKTKGGKTRKVLSLDLKLNVIRMFEEGSSNTEIARNKGGFLSDGYFHGLFFVKNRGPQ